MNPLPFRLEFVLALDYIRHQPPLVKFLDTNEIDRFRPATGTRQVDFRLPNPSDMDMRRPMIRCVDDEPEAVGTMNDNNSKK